MLAKTEQGAWIETKEMGTSHWSLQQSSKNSWSLHKGRILRRGNGSMLRERVVFSNFVQNDQISIRDYMKLAKIVKTSEIFNRLVFPLNFKRFCHPMTVMECVVNFSNASNRIRSELNWFESLTTCVSNPGGIDLWGLKRSITCPCYPSCYEVYVTEFRTTLYGMIAVNNRKCQVLKCWKAVATNNEWYT